MGPTKRDKQDKLKSQSLIDSERSVQSGGSSQQQQSSSSMITSSSTSSSSTSRKMQTASSSSSKMVMSGSDGGGLDQKISEIKSGGETSESVQQLGQRLSESKQTGQIASKQIENIIQEIKYIASDTADSTKRISTVQQSSDSTRSDKELHEALTNFDKVANATVSDIQQGATKISASDIASSETSVHKSASSSKASQSSATSASAIQKSQIMSSEKITSESSSSRAEQHSTSKTMKSSHTSSSSSSFAKKDSSTFLLDSSNIQMLQKSDANQKDSAVAQVKDSGNHSVLQTHQFHTDGGPAVGGGGRNFSDSQSYSFSEKNAPTTEVTYDSAGNKITSTTSSSSATHGFTSASFHSSGGGGGGGDSQLQPTSGAQTTRVSGNVVQDGHYTTSSSSASKSYSSSKQESSSSNTMNVSSVSQKDAVIDSTALENYKIQDSASQTNMLTKNASAHTIVSLSSANDSMANTIQSTQLVTEMNQDVSSKSQQHADSTKTYESSSHFESMDESNRSRKHVTDFYEQRESNSSILKRKIYDEKVKRLSLIDERVVPRDVVIQDIEDDVTNVTKTSFEAKLFNPKTKRWELVDQKTILEKDITVAIPAEIVHELEVERPELANITTTIQLTKVRPLCLKLTIIYNNPHLLRRFMTPRLNNGRQ